MAKCDICGKSVTFGIRVSHSHRRSNRTWKAKYSGFEMQSTYPPHMLHYELSTNQPLPHKSFVKHLHL